MDIATATEAELVTACRLGDRAAFGELVERCARMVNAVAFAATRDRALSQDVSQDTFVSAWQDLERLRDSSALRPWLCQIARNLAAKARRDTCRELPTDDLPEAGCSTTAFDSLRRAEVERLVADAVTRVPEPYREALVLFYYEERSAEAVATALGISAEVVFKRLSRGRAHVATALQPLFDSELTYRRPRRRLSACVLALLPAKGLFSMSKLGAIGISAVAVAGLVIALPTIDAAPRKQAPRAVVHAPRRTVTLPARLPATSAGAATTAAASTSPGCAAAARHIVDISLSTEMFRGIAKEHPDRVEQEKRRLEQECRDEAWSETDVNCVLGTGMYDKVEVCVPGSEKTRIMPVPAIHDLGCTAVGQHVGELMLANAVGPERGNVTAAIIEDPAEVLKDAKASCVDFDWSEPLRRCYAAATRMKDIVACKVQQD